MSKLLSAIHIAKLELKNRIVMPPMCMYEVAAGDGRVTPFHHVHYGQRAIGQVGLIIIEATAVEARGRLSNRDLGLWDVGRILRTFKIKKNVEVTDNGKIII